MDLQGVSNFTASSMDIQGVSLSTTSIMEIQGVSLRGMDRIEGKRSLTDG
jgi:hypothetical protein